MADIDIDPFGEHESRTDDHTETGEMLSKAAEELPSESDITGTDDIELQEIAEKALGIISQIKDVQTNTEDLFEHLLRELLGLDKQLRSIRGSLKVEVAKMVELEEHITKER